MPSRTVSTFAMYSSGVWSAANSTGAGGASAVCMVAVVSRARPSVDRLSKSNSYW
jgi:hypothetical protein